MKNLALKSTLLAAVILFAYGCQKTDNEEDKIIDQQDRPAVANLNAEVQNAHSLNNLLVQYHDSVEMHSDPDLVAHYKDRIHYYDSAYHQSESKYRTHHHRLNEKHRCDRMNGTMNNGHMMRRSGNSHHGGGYDCHLMERIMEYCNRMESLEQLHPRYCSY